MNKVHAIFSPVFGITLRDIDTLDLVCAKLFRNPAALAFSGTDLEVALEQNEIPTPNVWVPPDISIESAPPAPFDADLRTLGIAKYLLEVGIHTSTNELTDAHINEEFKWAVLPLRILTPARILVGLSIYCQGGCISSGSVIEEIKDRVRCKGILAPAPVPHGVSATCTITREHSKKITELASVINRHRSVLAMQLTVPIDTFSNSYYLASYTDRGMNLLYALEALFCERGLKRGFKNKAASRAARFLDGDRVRRRQTQFLISEAFEKRKDIEHGSKAKGIETEEYFSSHLEELEGIVRQIILRTIFLLDRGVELPNVLPGLHKASTSGGNKAKRSMNPKNLTE